MKRFMQRHILFIAVVVLLLGLVMSGLTAFGQDTGNIAFEFEHYNMGETVLPLGDEGDWDAGTTYGPIIVQDDDMLYMFYTGADSTMSEFAIGLATSTDGETWIKNSSNPILKHNGEENASVGVVTVVDGEWVMIYTEPTSSGSPDRNLYRATAESPEGPWENDADPVLVGTSGRWDRNAWPQGLVYVDGEYRLYYIGLNQFQQFPQIGLATSPDGITWTRYDDPATGGEFEGTDPILSVGEADAWDFMGLSTSNVLQTDDGWELFYVGYDRAMFTGATNLDPLQIGYATSPDGIHWTKYGDGPVLDTDEVAAPLINVTKLDDTYFIYYDINFGQGGIGLITGTVHWD